MNAWISFSRSTTNFNATDCTRPADLERILLCNSFDNLKPIIRSKIRLVSWECTRSISIARGDWNASCTAFFVISWNVTRSIASSASPNSWARCQLIASPSRSGSVARYTRFALAASSRSSFTVSFLSFDIS